MPLKIYGTGRKVKKRSVIKGLRKKRMSNSNIRKKMTKNRFSSLGKRVMKSRYI